MYVIHIEKIFKYLKLNSSMVKKSDELKALMENSVALQKAVLNLSLEIKKLTEELSNLISLFKEASKNINEEKTDRAIEKEEVKDIKEKVDQMMDQNKTIAKGLVLMESALRDSLEKKSASLL